MTQRTPDSPDYALPSHFFDQEATKVARPVVPLAPDGAQPTRSRRSSWLLGAVVLSAIIGSVAGIAAYNVYQRRATPEASRTAAPAVTTPATDVDTLTTAPTPAEVSEQLPSLEPSTVNEDAGLSTDSSVPRTSDSTREPNSSSPSTATSTTTAQPGNQPARNANARTERPATEDARASAPSDAGRPARSSNSSGEQPARRTEEASTPRVGKRGDKQEAREERNTEANDIEQRQRHRAERRAVRQDRQSERLRRVLEGDGNSRQRERPADNGVEDLFGGTPPSR